MNIVVIYIKNENESKENEVFVSHFIFCLQHRHFTSCYSWASLSTNSDTATLIWLQAGNMLRSDWLPRVMSWRPSGHLNTFSCDSLISECETENTNIKTRIQTEGNCEGFIWSGPSVKCQSRGVEGQKVSWLTH